MHNGTAQEGLRNDGLLEMGLEMGPVVRSKWTLGPVVNRPTAAAATSGVAGGTVSGGHVSHHTRERGSVSEKGAACVGWGHFRSITSRKSPFQSQYVGWVKLRHLRHSPSESRFWGIKSPLM